MHTPVVLFLGSPYLMVPSLYIRSILFFSSFIERELPLAFRMVMFTIPRGECHESESDQIPFYHALPFKREKNMSRTRL